jgi:hypothetical protein
MKYRVVPTFGGSHTVPVPPTHYYEACPNCGDEGPHPAVRTFGRKQATCAGCQKVFTVESKE